MRACEAGSSSDKGRSGVTKTLSKYCNAVLLVEMTAELNNQHVAGSLKLDSVDTSSSLS
jgi:hypothetical protein